MAHIQEYEESKMKKITAISAVMVILVGLLPLCPRPAIASQPQSVSIHTYGSFLTRSGTFDASGVITDGGTYFEDRIFFGDGIGHGTVILTNTSGTGTITFIWQAAITSDDQNGRTLEGRWNIVSGTGVYTNVHGKGTLSILVVWATTEVDVMLSGIAHFDERNN